MTFDEWRAEPYSRTFEDAWKAGAASRDAEVAELNSKLVAVNDNRVEAYHLHKERCDQLRKDVTLLRDAINDGCLCIAQYGEQPPDLLLEALAATEHHDRS